MDENELLNQTLEAGQTGPASNQNARVKDESPQPSSPSQTTQEYRQWQISPNDCFRPAGLTRKKLPAAVYAFEEDPYGLFIRQIRVISDDLLPLPDSANERVLKGMEVFWSRQSKYRDHGLLYKRGPPGSGKTATLQLLTQRLLGPELDGIVVLCSHPRLTSAGLAALRRIEPDRRLICLFEDIDEIIGMHGEHQILALLDGENQVENIVNIATTNYPERLGARIVNRPSRFDERIFVGMPSPPARSIYLRKVCIGMEETRIEEWVRDTEGLSIAHLRELAASVLCLGQSYSDVLARLRTMRHRIRDNEGIGGGVGFAGVPQHQPSTLPGANAAPRVAEAVK